MTVYEEDQRKLVSTDLNGEARRVHASGALNAGYTVSPAGDYAAVDAYAKRQNQVLYRAFFTGDALADRLRVAAAGTVHFTEVSSRSIPPFTSVPDGPRPSARCARRAPARRGAVGAREGQVRPA